MSQIAYDPVKDRFASLIRRNRFLRGLFYQGLDVFFLRSWYVRRQLRAWYRDNALSVNRAGMTLKVLDAGCGFGQYDQFMLRAMPGIRIDAVDVKHDYLDDCRYYFKKDIKRKDISFEYMDLLEPSFERTYNLVLCVDVMEHIEEDVTVLRNMYQALKPGGYFLMHSPSHLAEEDAGDDGSFVGEHARAGYSADEIGEKLRLVGLEPVDIRYTYGRFGHLAWEMLIKLPMLMLSRLGFVSVFLLPFWYILTLVPGLILMKIDLHRTNEQGTGILVYARKPYADETQI
jgi:SAM-dependent methyltransferase